MPDQRRHRGPHPDDLRLFAPVVWPVLCRASGDLNWLLTRGYPPESSLKLVGDRYALTARQRLAVARSTCSDAQAARRLQHRVSPDSLAGRSLWLDGYNVLTTIEAALAGGVLLAARDGTIRDMASMHGSYHRVEETLTALGLLGQMIGQWGIAEAVWLLDRPVSNSGRLKGLMLDLAAHHGWAWRVELEPNPDGVLAQSMEVVATADSVILDRCHAWVNLAREVVAARVPDAWLVDLSCESSPAEAEPPAQN